MAPVPQSCYHLPLPCSDAITFAAGLCSTHIPGQLAVRITVSVDELYYSLDEYNLFNEFTN